ncbi:MAG: putative iron-regulated protein [Flavobacteriales bacterium]|jgi:putative iron-regulated protein
MTPRLSVPSPRGAMMLAFTFLALAGCSDDAPSEEGLQSISESLRTDVITRYADVVHLAYSDTLAGVMALDATVDAFIADPTEQTMSSAKAAWLAVRDVYGRTEAFRFYDGPIDNEATGPEGQINAWPMDEVYLDYVDGMPEAGLINDASIEMTTATLVDANEVGGESNISTGFHAIEFLLWGQDLDDNGPGARPASDYATAPNSDRRAQALGLLTELLIEDIQTLVDAWDPQGSNHYRAEWLALEDAEAVRRMLRGIGALSKGELAGERIVVAYENRSQEDEHSCFSDNTHNDIIANASAIQVVWTGDWDNTAGPGLDSLVTEVDGVLAASTSAEIARSIALAESIPAPFDQWLAEGVADDTFGRTAIRDTYTALQDQGDLLAEVAAALDVAISLDI